VNKPKKNLPRITGAEIIKRMQDFLADVKAGKPMKQTIVRRMRVKGKTVFTHETFTGPLQRFSRGGR
jgi:hypothetical protein